MDSADVDDDFGPSLAATDVANCLAQWVLPIDHRAQLSGFGELLQDELSSPGPGATLA
jgi:hypothetical protein